MNPPARPLSVIDAASRAIERVKQILFRPFDLGRWLALGFTAWLATLGEAGGGGGGGGTPGNGNGRGAGTFRDFWDQTTDYVRENLAWLIVVVAVVLVVLLALGMLLTWLSSRGRFMFLHNVANNRAEVTAPWKAFAYLGNSLFVFRMVLGIASLGLSLPFLVIGGWSVITMLIQESVEPIRLVLAIGSFGILILQGLAYFVISTLTVDFVVPIMMLRGSTCRKAWGEFRALLSAYPGGFLIYLLFGLVLDFALGVAVLLCVIVCCPLCCLLALPYLGTVLLLPAHVFLRAYSAEFLAHFGPGYDVFPAGAQEPSQRLAT